MIILQLKLYFKNVVIKNWDTLSKQIQEIVLYDLKGYNIDYLENGTIVINAELSDLYQLVIILSNRYKVFIN